MPSVVSNHRTQWVSPVTCEICHKTLENVQALACHLRTHLIDMRTNPNATTIAASMGMSSRHSPYFHTKYGLSLLSPSSFSLYENNNALMTSSNRSYRHHAALSPTMAVQKPDTGFNGSMKSCNNMFSVMETPSSLYNVVPYSRDAWPHILSDGVTRQFICQLDRPLPVIIELDSDGEDNEVQKEEMLDLSLKL